MSMPTEPSSAEVRRRPCRLQEASGSHGIRSLAIARSRLGFTTLTDRHPSNELGVQNMLKSFLSDEKGLETVEYAIIAGLIVVALITLITTIGSKVYNKFNNLNAAL
jgi:Flp pilus assembly pilin Flp